jgi:hypothetical protein
MAKIYANLIVKGLKKLHDVPAALREDVKEILIGMGIEVEA